MKKTIIILISLSAILLLPKAADAGIIIRPVFHTGLIGYWDFQEGAGTTANDKSGKDNDGTLTNMENSDWKNGKIGRALDFDGSAEYVNLGTTADLPEKGPYTLTAWINGNALGADEKNVISRWDDTGSKFAFIMSATINYATCYGRNAADNRIWYAEAVQGVETNNDKWVFIACVMGSGELYAYRYGVADSRRTAGSDQGWDVSGTGAAVTIGARSTGASYFFPGTIDEVRVYNRALSESEIQRLYKLSQPKILAPTKTGLVGYWSFEENTGTKAGDMSGNGNHGTLTNMTESDWVDGKVGGALDFDGSDDGVAVAANASHEITGAITLSAWVYLRTDNASGRKIITKYFGGSSAQIDYMLQIYPSYSTFRLAIGGVSNQDVNGIEVPLNEWTHLVGTYDGANMRIYHDGVKENSVAKTGNITATAGKPLLIGNSGQSEGGIGTDATRNFDGLIDEVRIYNRALEQSEITALYNSGLAKINASQNNQLTNGLVGLWSFNGPDMDGTTAIDRSGQGNNGTLTNGPTRTIGKVGQALSFDGSDDYINIGNYPNLMPGSITISAWINPQSIGTSPDRYPNIISQDSWRAFGNNPRGYYLEIYRTITNPSPSFYVANSSTYAHSFATTDVSNNVWYHVAGTYDASTGQNKIYINGSYEGVDTMTGNIVYDASKPIRIGFSAYYYWQGAIDEVRIYNRALSAREILRLYNMGR